MNKLRGSEGIAVRDRLHLYGNGLTKHPQIARMSDLAPVVPIMANPSVEVKQRVVDFRPQPVGEGNEQNYPKEPHYLTGGKRARYQ